jgi:hypothetical protein
LLDSQDADRKAARSSAANNDILEQHPEEFGATIALSLPMFVELFVRIASARYKPTSTSEKNKLAPSFSEVVQFALDTHIAGLSRNIRASEKKNKDKSKTKTQKPPSSPSNQPPGQQQLIVGALSTRKDAREIRRVLIRHHATLRRMYKMAADPLFHQGPGGRASSKRGSIVVPASRKPRGSIMGMPLPDQELIARASPKKAAPSRKARGSIMGLPLQEPGKTGRGSSNKAPVEDDIPSESVSIAGLCSLFAYVGLANDSRMPIDRVARLTISVTAFIGFEELEMVSFEDFIEIVVWCCRERTINDRASLATRLDGMLTAKLVNCDV